MGLRCATGRFNGELRFISEAGGASLKKNCELTVRLAREPASDA